MRRVGHLARRIVWDSENISQFGHNSSCLVRANWSIDIKMYTRGENYKDVSWVKAARLG